MVVADPDVRGTNQHVEILMAASSAQTKVLAFAPLYPTFVYGERVRVLGTLSTPEPFQTDGGRVFAYDKYLAKDGVFAIVSPAHIEVTAPPSGAEAKAMDALYGMKHVFVRGLESALPEPAASLAEGLLTGGKQGLGSSLINAFTVAGLLQIVVLSGYNVMIVAEGVLKLFARLPRRAAYVLAAMTIVGFIVAAGSGSSAVRAGIMACLALYGRATGRTYSALRALTLAVFLMLVWNPFYLVYDPGFELSVAATLGLILGTPYVESYLARMKSSFLREAIATTVAAQVSVLPILLYETGNLSLVSVPANILVMPVVPLAMVLSFIAGIVGMLAPPLAPVAGFPAYFLLSYIIAVGKYAAMLPFAHVIIPAFPFAVVVFMYVALCWYLRTRKPLYRIGFRTPSS
jgi:competence protein ComEC